MKKYIEYRQWCSNYKHENGKAIITEILPSIQLAINCGDGCIFGISFVWLSYGCCVRLMRKSNVPDLATALTATPNHGNKYSIIKQK